LSHDQNKTKTKTTKRSTKESPQQISAVAWELLGCVSCELKWKGVFTLQGVCEQGLGERESKEGEVSEN